MREALAIRMVDALYAQGDVSAGLRERLPPSLDPLAVPMAGAVRQVALESAERLLERPGVQRLWRGLNRTAHLRLVALLEGDEDALIRTADGSVVLDLQPLVERLRGELGLGGRPPAGRAVITIMEAHRLEAAQNAVRTIKVSSAMLGVVALGLLALAVWLARSFRREAVRAAAWGLLAFLAGGTRAATRIRAWLAPTMRARPAVAFEAALLAVLALLAVGPVAAPRRLVGLLVIVALVMGGIEALRRQTGREFPGPR